MLNVAPGRSWWSQAVSSSDVSESSSPSWVLCLGGVWDWGGSDHHVCWEVSRYSNGQAKGGGQLCTCVCTTTAVLLFWWCWVDRGAGAGKGSSSSSPSVCLWVWNCGWICQSSFSSTLSQVLIWVVHGCLFPRIKNKHILCTLINMNKNKWGWSYSKKKQRYSKRNKLIQINIKYFLFMRNVLAWFHLYI